MAERQPYEVTDLQFYWPGWWRNLKPTILYTLDEGDQVCSFVCVWGPLQMRGWYTPPPATPETRSGTLCTCQCGAPGYLERTPFHEDAAEDAILFNPQTRAFECPQCREVSDG